MNYRPITLDGVTRTISEWAASVGLSNDALSKRLKKGIDPREAIFSPHRRLVRAERERQRLEAEAALEQAEREELARVDAIAASAEPDRRILVYGMVCCGTSDAEIVEATGFDAAEVAKYRRECPQWWAVDMRRHKEFDESRKGKER